MNSPRAPPGRASTLGWSLSRTWCHWAMRRRLRGRRISCKRAYKRSNRCSRSRHILVPAAVSMSQPTKASRVENAALPWMSFSTKVDSFRTDGSWGDRGRIKLSMACSRVKLLSTLEAAGRVWERQEYIIVYIDISCGKSWAVRLGAKCCLTICPPPGVLNRLRIFMRGVAAMHFRWCTWEGTRLSLSRASSKSQYAVLVKVVKGRAFHPVAPSWARPGDQGNGKGDAQFCDVQQARSCTQTR